MLEAQELIEVGSRLKIKVELLDQEKSLRYIKQVLANFKPFKTTGHLGIDNDSITIPLENNEFSYPQYLDKEVAYIFFDQGDSLGRKTVVKINDVRSLGKLLEESFGMEYFLFNEKMDYLIAVNWYVIEVSGTAKEKLSKLN